MPSTAAAQLHPAGGPQTPTPVHKSAGRRLLEAFKAFESFPVFAGSRGQVIQSGFPYRIGVDLAAAIESDVALTVAVLRRANADGRGREQISTVPQALSLIGPDELRAIVDAAPSFDFFETTTRWGSAPQSHRLHAGATQRAAARIAREMGFRRTDELLVAALLHDIGKLVLVYAYDRYGDLPGAASMTPERRLERERREFGFDHASVGGVLARRWGLPHHLAQAIERHHQPDESGLAGLVRLADMIVRFEAGNPVGTTTMRATADVVGLGGDGLRAVLSAQPQVERRSILPSPLTPGEQRVMGELAKGRLYKEIAAQLGVSASTVRSHLHNAYGKLGVADRAQAILLATDHGWI